MESLSLLRSVLVPRSRSPMRESAVLCAKPEGLHRMAYTEWGDVDNPRVVVCAHGLTRNGRDFDFFAQAICDEARVVCPDVAGRGASEWLANPAHYNIPAYVNDMVTLIARLDVEEVMWVGTSMGGLIGMALASMPGSPIRKLVVNDVGPVIERESILRIGEYVGLAPNFANVEEAERYVRAISASFGPLTDEQWHHITVHALRECEGGFEMRYDPAIGRVFRDSPPPADVDLWGIWESIRCPVMALRGATSDLLSTATFEAMGARGPRAQLMEFDGVGHAPMLMDEAQIEAVAGFLLDEGAGDQAGSVS